MERRRGHSQRRRPLVLVAGRAGTGVGAVVGAALLLAACASPPPSRPSAAHDVALAVPTLSQHEVDGSGPFAPSTGGGDGPCDQSFIADMVGDFDGEPSAGDALEAWLTGPPFDVEAGNLGVLPGAPPDGWVASGSDAAAERTFTAGGWEVLTRQSSRGGWLVTQAGCSPSVDAGQPAGG